MRRRQVVAGALLVLGVVGAALLALALTGGDDAAEPAEPAGNADPASGGRSGVAVEVTSGGDAASGCLLLADSDEERRQGLMGVTDLAGFDGMLFEFPDQQPRSFWMRNTPMPLSIAFFDGAGSFVSSADMSPCGDREDCPLTASAAPAMFAVEVPRGELRSLGLVPGSKLRVGGTCRP